MKANNQIITTLALGLFIPWIHLLVKLQGWRYLKHTRSKRVTTIDRAIKNMIAGIASEENLVSKEKLKAFEEAVRSVPDFYWETDEGEAFLTFYGEIGRGS